MWRWVSNIKIYFWNSCRYSHIFWFSPARVSDFFITCEPSIFFPLLFCEVSVSSWHLLHVPFWKVSERIYYFLLAVYQHLSSIQPYFCFTDSLLIIYLNTSFFFFHFFFSVVCPLLIFIFSTISLWNLPVYLCSDTFEMISDPKEQPDQMH